MKRAGRLLDPMTIGRAIALASFLLAAGPVLTAEPVRLTDDGRWKQDPVFLFEGREVVYVDTGKNPNLVLMKLDLTSKQSSRLHPNATLPEFKPSYSADEKTTAYLTMTGNDNLFLYVRAGMNDPAAVKLQPMVAWHPSISPDGQRVFYNGNGQIRSVRVGENGQGMDEAFITSGGRNDWPAISPDGRRIAFGSSRDGNFEIYVASMDDAANPLRLTNTPTMEMRPAWSPDGKRIAFTSRRDGNLEIYVMNADGGIVRRITQNPERDDYASWHPNGKQLVHVSERDGEFDLYLTEVPQSDE